MPWQPSQFHSIWLLRAKAFNHNVFVAIRAADQDRVLFNFIFPVFLEPFINFKPNFFNRNTVPELNYLSGSLFGQTSIPKYVVQAIPRNKNPCPEHQPKSLQTLQMHKRNIYSVVQMTTNSLRAGVNDHNLLN